MRRTGVSLAVLSVLLTLTTVMSGRPHPFQMSRTSTQALAGQVPEIRNQTAGRTAKGNSKDPADIVAQDVARTASLCVSDCQSMLAQTIAMLEHEPTFAGQKRIIEQTLKRHPQFHTLRLRLPGSGVLTFGTAPARETVQRLEEAEHEASKQNKTYLSDLSPVQTHGDADFRMAVAAPMAILDSQQMPTGYGIISVDTSLEVLSRVAKHLDRKFSTSTSIRCAKTTVQVGESMPLSVQGAGGIHSAPAKVETVPGSGWIVNSHPRLGEKSKQSNRKASAQAKDTSEVIVRFSMPKSPSELHRMETDTRSKLVISRHSSRLYVFRADGDRLADLSSYFFSLGALSVEPHTVLRVHQEETEQPNDVLYTKYQWNFPFIGVDQEWNTSTGDPSVVVAVVDTGVDQNHPEFRGQLTSGYNVLNPGQPPDDDNGHGTHVAGVIAAKTNNLEGVAGITWNSRIMPVKAMDKDGTGSVADIVTGIEWAVDHGANVINLSLGNEEDSGILHQAVQYAVAHNVAVTVAMGNENTNTPSYPAAYPEAIAVCAVDSDGQRASFSNYGPNAFISAPGVSIASTYPDRRYAAMSGTSMASPHIAGVIGLLKSINPQLTVDQIKDILKTTATDLGDPGFDPYYGYGLVNAPQAAAKAANPT